MSEKEDLSQEINSDFEDQGPYSLYATQAPSPENTLNMQESLEASRTNLSDLENKLLNEIDFSTHEILNIDYKQMDPRDLDGQIAATMLIIQKGIASIKNGELIPGSQVLFATQQEGRWAQGSEALPMGKIDIQRDLSNFDYNNLIEQLPEESKEIFAKEYQSAAQMAIIGGGMREFHEEIMSTPTISEHMLCGSFRDKTTENVVHVIAQNIQSVPENESFMAGLNDLREHKKIELVEAEKMLDLNLDNGTKMALLVAIKAILNKNNEHRIES